MALPLPSVVADTKAGGPLVTSLGGMNALYNSYLQNQIDQAKAQYAPWSEYSNSASKLAYARLMGPQFLAKMMGNKDILANIPDEKLQQVLGILQNAGTGQATGGGAGGMTAPQPSSGQQTDNLGLPVPGGTVQNAPQNSFSSYLVDKIKNIFSGSENKPSGAGNPFAGSSGAMGSVGAVAQDNAPSSSAPKNSMTDLNKITNTDPNSELGIARTAWMRSPEAAQEADKQGYYPAKSDQQLLDWYRQKKTDNGGISAPVNNGMASVKPGDFATNVGNYKGKVAEGEEAGKIRAQDIKELNDIVFSGKTQQTTLDSISNILGSPAFEQMRQVPLAGHHELSYFSKFGTPEQQNMVGQYYTLTGNIIKDSARDFAGPFRKTEQQLLQGMKPAAADTVDTARGKTESLSVMSRMLTERARLASEIMNKYHVNKLQAQEAADKQVNGDEIRRQVHDKLNPTVTIRNKKTGEVKTVPAAEAKKMMVLELNTGKGS